MGDDFWTYGLKGNEAPLETFRRYSHEQGPAGRRLSPAEPFAAETLETHVV